MSATYWLLTSHGLLLADASANHTQIEVALIAAGALIFGGITQQLLSRKDKEPIAWKTARTAQESHVRELQKQLKEKSDDLDELEQTFRNAMTGMQLRDQENQRLRDLCWEHGVNPNPPVSLTHPPEPRTQEPGEETPAHE